MQFGRRALLTLSAGCTLAAGSFALHVARRADTAPGAQIRDEAQLRERNLAFYEWRLTRDPSSAFDLGQLASLYLQRGRERGDPQDVLRAEALARNSIADRATRNTHAYMTLVSTLMTQHRFVEARGWAERLVTLDSTSLTARAVLGEIEMELGDYAAARRRFGALYGRRATLAVAPRLARWLELQGRVEAARRLLSGALDSARAQPRLPREQLAWFHLRLGDLELRSGHLGTASRVFGDGLAIAPQDARLLAAMARLETARGRWRRAVDFGEQAIAIAPDPATLGLVGDGYFALGDSAQSASYWHAMEAVTLAQPGGFHRAWSLFLLDHGRRVPEVLDRVREEIRSRPDVYGWDLLAWALHLAGRDREALPAMARALSLGTRDATLFYHAGMIERSLGHRLAARDALTRALAADPWFPQAALARDALESF